MPRTVVSTLIAAMVALATAALEGTLAAAAAEKAGAPPPIGDADGDGDVDLDDLVKRIGDSSAIGTFTKLSLKLEIDRFERDLRAFHDRAGKHSLGELHERYDLLVHKLMRLLQDKDPGLAREIAEARDFLWAKLADPREFRRM